MATAIKTSRVRKTPKPQTPTVSAMPPGIEVIEISDDEDVLVSSPLSYSATLLLIPVLAHSGLSQ
jgi:hypothetical protein